VSAGQPLHSRQPLPISEDWVRGKVEDIPWVAKTRERLQSISWFMKCLKELISRRANQEDKCRGAFFEARFKSVAILDDEALLATSTYIDLNRVAAKIAEIPETSEHTSIKQRVEHIKAQDATTQLEAAKSGSVAGPRSASGLAEALWLCPIEDRRELDSSREGMFEGLSIGNYLLLVTSKAFRFPPHEASALFADRPKLNSTRAPVADFSRAAEPPGLAPGASRR
jgi:hypothetical protein